MADIRIKDLTTTASSTASDDFIAVDGTTNGTRKLSAFSPTFGGNATVTGTLTGNSTATIAGRVISNASSTATDSAGFAHITGYSSGGKTYTGFAAGGIAVNQSAAFGYVYDSGTPANSFAHITPYGSTEGSLFKFSPAGVLTLGATTASTTTSTGALVVSGGVGVAGNINAGGYLRSINSSAANGSEFTALRADVGADGTLGAALVTIGVLPSATAASRYGFITCYDNGDWRTLYLGGSPGVAANGGQVRVPANIASTSTSSGALVVSGGVGVAGAAFLGGNVTSAGTRGFVRYKSSNGSTASPVEDRIVGFSNTNDLLFEGGMYGVNSLSDNSAVWLRFKTLNTSGTAVTALTLDAAQKAEFAATIKTAAPAGGTAAEWKLGTVATVSPTSPNRTIEVDIGGTIYYIHAKTTNN